MSASPSSTLAQPTLLPWAEPPEQQNRLRAIVLGSLAGILGIVLILDLLVEPAEIERRKLERVPPRVARFILQRESVPPPPVTRAPEIEAEPEVTEIEAPEPEPVRDAGVRQAAPPDLGPRTSAEATPTQIRQARETASRSGLLAMSDQLAALRDLSNVDQLTSRKLKAVSSGRAARSDDDLIKRKALGGSGGIESTAVTARDSEQLAGRSTTEVDVPQELVEAQRRAAAPAARQRTSEDIQLTFDQHKASFYALYRRALRRRGGLEGRVVFDMEIAPNGQVTRCVIASSELDDPELERKLIARIKLIDFGTRDVEIWKSDYHIDFSPSG